MSAPPPTLDELSALLDECPEADTAWYVDAESMCVRNSDGMTISNESGRTEHLICAAVNVLPTHIAQLVAADALVRAVEANDAAGTLDAIAAFRKAGAS